MACSSDHRLVVYSFLVFGGNTNGISGKKSTFQIGPMMRYSFLTENVEVKTHPAVSDWLAVDAFVGWISSDWLVQ